MISLCAVDVGFDLRVHDTPVSLPGSRTLSVRCHPAGTTAESVTYTGPRGSVIGSLIACGYRVAVSGEASVPAFETVRARHARLLDLCERLCDAFDGGLRSVQPTSAIAKKIRAAVERERAMKSRAYAAAMGLK